MLWLLKLYMSPLIAGVWMTLYSSTRNLTLQHKTRLNVVHTRRQMQFMTSYQMDLPKQMAFCSSATFGNAKRSTLHTKHKAGRMTNCHASNATSVDAEQCCNRLR